MKRRAIAIAQAIRFISCTTTAPSGSTPARRSAAGRCSITTRPRPRSKPRAKISIRSTAMAPSGRTPAAHLRLADARQHPPRPRQFRFVIQSGRSAIRGAPHGKLIVGSSVSTGVPATLKRAYVATRELCWILVMRVHGRSLSMYLSGA